MNKKTLFYIVVVILSIALYGTFRLVQQEYMLGDQCPKILSIPACYIVLVCFGSALIGHITNRNIGDIIFRIAMVIVTLIAMYGTIGEVFGFAECPKSSLFIPMCYISLSICISVIWAKYAYQNKVN